MVNRLLSLLLLLAALCLGACSIIKSSGPLTFPKIDRHPPPRDLLRGAMTSVPVYDPDNFDTWQMDLRGYDLSTLDLSGSLNDLLHATFDDGTVWPPEDRMPQGFDRQRIMELGKDPGLGVRDLHARGITGKNVGIAIIDQTLLVDHQEYADQLRLYEETDDLTDGMLNAPIDQDENGNTVSGNPWTGTESDGSPAADTCGDWMDGTGGSSGARGEYPSTSARWTRIPSTAPCNFMSSLYCFSDGSTP